MEVTSVKKAYLAASQLKGVALVLYDQWKDGRLVEMGPIEWKYFKLAFLDSFSP